MNLENKPVQIFIKEAMLRSPQGLVVLFGFITYWLLSVLILSNPELILPKPGMQFGILFLYFSWPFVLLMTFVKFSSPNYTASLFDTIFIFGEYLAPLWWVYKNNF